MSTTNLLINIDHVATLRNARRESFPDPVRAAAYCENAGADGIVFHLREDRRHINERDVRLLKETVRGRLDFELAMNDEVLEICCDVQPDLATLVPERREEVTTEGGLDVIGNRERVRDTIKLLHAADIEVSLFIDPELDQIEEAAECGADCIELHTGEFASARSLPEQHRLAEILGEGARAAAQAGLHVHAGHGLDYFNYRTFRQHVSPLREVSIGFAIIARAVYVGLDVAVRDMLALVKEHHVA